MNQKAIKTSPITDMEPMITLDPEVLLTLPASLVLEPHTVHVWAFTLEGSAALAKACRDVLSPAERQRAGKGRLQCGFAALEGKGRRPFPF